VATLGAGPLALSAGCSTLPPPATTPAERASPALDFDASAEAFAADWMRLSPERTTASQYFEGAEQDRLDGELNPAFETQRERARTLARQGLAMTERWLAMPLSPDQRAAAATVQWSLQRSLAGAPFDDYTFAFNQLNGLQVRSVNLLTTTQPLRRASDVQNYLLRLAQLPLRFDEAIARTRAAAARGILPPRFILERGRGQIEAFLRPEPADNLFVTALAERSKNLPGLSADERSRAVQRAHALVAEQVRPAFERARALLNELHPHTTADAGLWRLPEGAAAYAQALARNTTTAMSADEIHRLGLREVARIEAEMDRVLQTLGRKDGTVQSRMDALRVERQVVATAGGPDPRPQLLARYAEYINEAQARSAALFNLKPSSPVEVRRVPALTERTASAYYTTPTSDGSRPGIFWVPLPAPHFDVLRMKTLAFHEAVPGHHFQLALQQEQTQLPRWRRLRVFGGGSAHSEGWALYAERLAIDQGWYAGDSESLLGAWEAQRFRARRLVVDTGLHAKRWTREQAIDYGINAQEVERYVANPGQACAYMIGMLRILALRDEARTALGAKFSLPAFHDVVLKTGSVPLDVLGDVVRRWVAQPT